MEEKSGERKQEPERENMGRQWSSLVTCTEVTMVSEVYRQMRNRCRRY